MAFFTVAQQVALIKATDGVVVAHGGETTYGHPAHVALNALEGEGGMGAVGTAYRFVDIVNGSLSGITPDTGRNTAITVDGVSRTVRDIETIEEDGGMLRVWLSEVEHG